MAICPLETPTSQCARSMPHNSGQDGWVLPHLYPRPSDSRIQSVTCLYLGKDHKKKCQDKEGAQMGQDSNLHCHPKAGGTGGPQYNGGSVCPFWEDGWATMASSC